MVASTNLYCVMSFSSVYHNKSYSRNSSLSSFDVVQDVKGIMLFVLHIVDLVLVGNLVLMIIFAGYENFVSKMHVADESEDKPTWMGTVDFSELKLKLVASIVTISGINLLAAFMDLSQVSDREIYWMVIVHLLFILSGVLLALMDFITSKSKSI